MNDPYNVGKALSELTRGDIDSLFLNTSMAGEYNKISIDLKTGKSLVYIIPVVISCSNGKYIIDDGVEIEIIPVDEVEDYEGLR